MHFRAIDERPFAVPQPGVPRLLLGFAALSLLLHSLLFISDDDTTPLNINQLGAPYIRAILSNEQMPSAKRPVEKQASAQTRATRKDAPIHNKIKTPIPHRQAAKARESTPPSSAATETREPENTAETTIEIPAKPPAKSTDSKLPSLADKVMPATENRTEKSAENAMTMDASAQRNHLLGELQDQLSRYLTYPLHARRRGWEGEVLLGLHLDARGHLHNIHLLRSSGYALLDRSALKALARIERLRLPPSAPPLQPTELQLPVVYRLSES